MNNNLLEANLEAPYEELPTYYCDWCSEGLFKDDIYFEINGERVCKSCVDSCKCNVEFADEEIDEEI